MANLEVFFSYAHADEYWRDQLERHLGSLKRQKRLITWHDRKILPGTEWAQEIDTRLSNADIIFLLISPDFISSDYCYCSELKKAIRRHNKGEAHVIPIIVRPVDWKGTPFAKLQALPNDAKPISTASNSDEALLQVAQHIRKLVEAQKKKRSTSTTLSISSTAKPPQHVSSSANVWNVPFLRNPFFTGREQMITHIRTILIKEQTASVSQPPAISGLGGIGKTQLAVEYAYRYREQYQQVLWVQANSLDILQSDMLTLATLLNLPEKEAQYQQQAIQAVKQWLAEHSNWLLIFDNADDLSLVDPYLSIRTSQNSGHLLLTTRTHATGSRAQRVDVEKMDIEEGTLFFLHRATLLAPDAPLSSLDETTQHTARTIVDAVDGLPLALDQAGAYIEETGCSLSRYLTLYQTQRKELHQRRGKQSTDHPEPVATTWSLSFQKVAAASPLAADLLRLCAFLSPDTIPEELVTESVPFLNPALPEDSKEHIQVDEALGELLRYSLVQRHSVAQMLSIHRVVQAVLKDEMDKQTHQQWAERIVGILNQFFPFGDATTWSLCQRYLPHALVCTQYIQQWNLVSKEAANLLHNVASYLDDRARYQEAEPLYRHALVIKESVQGPEHPDTASTVHNLAILYWNRGRYEQAEPLFKRALVIKENALGPEHLDTARSLHNLAILYKDQGKYEQAEPLFKRALTIREYGLGLEHPDIASTLHNLANLYRDLGKYGQAGPLYQRALTIKERVLGSEHPDTKKSQENYASLQNKRK